MIYNLQSIRKQILGLGLSEVGFKARGFAQGYDAQERLELVAKTVVSGYNAAVEYGLNKDLQTATASVKNELVGFFNEGIGMGLYALDLFSLRSKNRFWEFVKGPGSKHEYMSYIGAGLASGVFGLPFKKFLDKASPTSGCLILDGIGFYYAYFKTNKTVHNFYVPASVRNDAFYLERYDNGIGRALWFYNSGDPKKIAQTVAAFPEERQPHVWSGVGLAATYAGGVSKDKIRLLKRLSGPHSIMLAQGSLLAVHTRYTAGNPHEDDSTVRILVGKPAEEAHLFAVEAIEALRNRRYIDGKHSFQVFLENIRKWIHAEVYEHQDF